MGGRGGREVREGREGGQGLRLAGRQGEGGRLPGGQARRGRWAGRGRPANSETAAAARKPNMSSTKQNQCTALIKKHYYSITELI